MFNYKLNYKLPKKIKGRIKEYLLLYENYSCFPIIMDPCNFFFSLTLLGHRWAPWFLLGNWLFYAHSPDLLGLISLREMKDYL